MKEFIESLLGRPWKRGAPGPDTFDCWSLVQHVEKELAGRDVLGAEEPPPEKIKPLTGYVQSHPARTQWHKIDKPVHLCVVEMAHHSWPIHVGVYLDVEGGLVVHCAPGVGVTVDSILALKTAGWRNLRFNDWNG